GGARRNARCSKRRRRAWHTKDTRPSVNVFSHEEALICLTCSTTRDRLRRKFSPAELLSVSSRIGPSSHAKSLDLPASARRHWRGKRQTGRVMKNYELERGHDLGESLRHIFCKQVALAIDYASGARKPPDTPVHETRKRVKKARAALRLIEKTIRPRLFKKQDHGLRDVGRLISDLRDAEVRLQTLDYLLGRIRLQGREKYGELRDFLQCELNTLRRHRSSWPKQVIPVLKNIHDEVAGWKLESYRADDLRRAVQRTYKRARRTAAAAEKKRSPECFHVFRGEAKQFGYELRIIRPINPAMLARLTRDLQRLGELLGRHHDLVLLAARLTVIAGHEQQCQELCKAIEAEMYNLQRKACHLAAPFFAGRARDMGRCIEEWLDDWNHVKTAHKY
ncbi:MAG: CHAD domain-containing protein, partial [Chthoniobacterales bacterium]